MNRSDKQAAITIINKFNIGPHWYITLTMRIPRHIFISAEAFAFWVWDNTFHRPTRDIDLLGFGSGDPPTLKKIFLDIIIIKCNDGFSFDTSSVSSEIIKEEAAYQGVRVTGFASLNKAIIPYLVDIGFGDVVTPEAEFERVPSYLDLPQAGLKVYPVETIRCPGYS